MSQMDSSDDGERFLALSAIFVPNRGTPLGTPLGTPPAVAGVQDLTTKLAEVASSDTAALVSTHATATKPDLFESGGLPIQSRAERAVRNSVRAATDASANQQRHVRREVPLPFDWEAPPEI